MYRTTRTPGSSAPNDGIRLWTGTGLSCVTLGFRPKAWSLRLGRTSMREYRSDSWSWTPSPPSTSVCGFSICGMQGHRRWSLLFRRFDFAASAFPQSFLWWQRQRTCSERLVFGEEMGRSDVPGVLNAYSITSVRPIGCKIAVLI